MNKRSLDILVFVGAWTAWAVFLSALVAYTESIPFVYALYCNMILVSISAFLSLPVIWAVGRFGSRRRNPFLTILAVLVGCLLYSAAWIWLSYGIFVTLFGRYFMNLFDPRSGWIFLIGVVMGGVIFGISYLKRYSKDLHEAELKRAELQIHARESELRALRSQLNPHFLFNSINSVYAMIGSSPQKAKDMLVKLSDLLRLSLVEMDTELIPFERDWSLTRRYLDIERIRFEDRLLVRTEIDEDILSEPVPSFLLQPIVENAVKHGVAVSQVPVTITISGRRNGSHIDITVSNTGQYARHTPGRSSTSKGRGLQNLAARLTRIYGENHRLLLTDTADGGFQVSLSLPAAGNGEIS